MEVIMSKNALSSSVRLVLPTLLLAVLTSSATSPALAKKHHTDKDVVAISTTFTAEKTEVSARRPHKVRVAKEDYPNVNEFGDSGENILAP
jgi:hypothetical protein